MVNEDIVTSLRNAVNNGEALETAMNTLINSGYDSREVEEASQFISGGVMPSLQTDRETNFQPQQQILKPTQPALQKQSLQKTFQPLPSSLEPGQTTQTQEPQQTAQNQTQNQNKKKSYAKEIILVIILLILLAVLGATIFFRDAILRFFSS